MAASFNESPRCAHPCSPTKVPWTRTLLFGLLTSLLGCSNALPPLIPPDWNSAAGEAAIQEYDTDGDGLLAAAELDRVPALKSATSRIDTNYDNKLSPDEINARIQKWRDRNVAIMPATVNVLKNGQPQADIEVTLVPEKCLGDAIKPAKGTTNQDGTAIIRISSSRDEEGVHQGFYRIVLSKKGSNGETIPPKYNSQTELGAEVAADSPALKDIMINLESR